MNNIEYLKNELKIDIKIATKEISKLYNEVRKIESTYPNDCLGLTIDGQVCENKDLKIDILTNYYHQIGYFECLKNNSKVILDILNMSDKELSEMIENNKKIEKDNKNMMNELFNKFR
jgi:hypothetical protein